MAGALRPAESGHQEPLAVDEGSLSVLKKSGVRSTWLRMAVLEIMQGHPGPMSVQDVFQRVQARTGYPNLSGVYAALKTLASTGLLAVHIGPGRKLMYATSSQGNVCFFTCSRCGRESGIHDPRIERFVGLICQDQGLPLQNFRLQIASICPACGSGD